MRAAVWQSIALFAAALICLPKGALWSAAVLLSGSGVLAGNWVAARLALGGGVLSAAAVLRRLLVGMLLKWLLVVAVIAIALALVHMPAIPVFLGVLTALLAFVLANSIRQ